MKQCAWITIGLLALLSVVIAVVVMGANDTSSKDQERL